MSDTDKLRKDLVKLFKDELGPFFKALAKEEKAFFAKKARQIAEHRVKLERATDDATIRKEKRLLRALGASVAEEILDLKLKISAKAREMVAKGIRIAISALIAAI